MLANHLLRIGDARLEGELMDLSTKDVREARRKSRILIVGLP
jgi:hypothetical protein